MSIAILNYLRDNPGAKDNAEGIAKWWVNEDPLRVQESLQILISEGVIEQKGSMYQLKLESKGD